MKAYKAFDAKAVEQCSTVVFAENSREARKIAFSTETCEDAEWIDVRVQRFPQMDEHYRGLPEIDWYNEQDRIALVSLGWHCYEPSFECDTCPARQMCYWQED